MKTTLHYLSLNAQATWHHQVDQQLQHLHTLTPITAAEVVLKHQKEHHPSFRVQVRLEVPGPTPPVGAARHKREAALLLHGPSLQAEASDSTLEAALLKTTRNLAHQVQAHALRRQKRDKSQLQLSAVSDRWTHAQTGRSVSTGRNTQNPTRP
jgi:ribosome-associated translation inhibitor RaiA